MRYTTKQTKSLASLWSMGNVMSGYQTLQLGLHTYGWCIDLNLSCTCETFRNVHARGKKSWEGV